MVLTEGIVVGIIGTVLGIVVGLLGIGITLGVVNKLLTSMLTLDVDIPLKLIVSIPAIIVAVAFIIVTIFIAILRPARTATKTSPIDSIKQTDDIKIKAKKVKTNKLVRKIFGVEGEIALKNLKRSKKRYRTTVISLVISIVLFITFSGLIDYMFIGTNMQYMTIPYDFVIIENMGEGLNKSQLEKISNISEIKSSLRVKELEKFTVADKDYPAVTLDEKLIENYIKENEDVRAGYMSNEEYRISTFVQTVSGNEMQEYLKSAGLNELKDGEVILVDKVSINRTEYSTTKLKEKDKIELETCSRETLDSDFEEGTVSLEIAKVVDKGAFGIPNMIPAITIIVNENTFNKIENEHKVYGEEEAFQTNTYIKTDNIEEVEKQLEEILGETDISYMNVADMQSQMNNLKLIMSIFLYGFITLITLIGVSNVFNTISTNVNLRRREFAMLKSIGMTKRGFNKMIYLECIFYGLKSIIIGLPIGIGLCYLLYNSIMGIFTFEFTLPIFSIIACTIAVFVIVFITMIYSIRKVKKDNIIDVLRQDNI